VSHDDEHDGAGVPGADLVLAGEPPAGELAGLAVLAPYARDTVIEHDENPQTWNSTASKAFEVLPPVLLLALRATLPMPRPGERYHARGMSALWLARHYRNSPHTCEAYARAMTGWLDYCQLARLNPLTAITPDIDEWTQRLVESGASTSVINQRLAGVGSWYRYLRNGVPITDPMTDAWRPEPAADDESESPFLTIAQNGRLLRQAMLEIDEAGDDALRRERALRLASLLWMLSTTAIRSGAVLAGWVGDLRHNGGHRFLRYHLKGHADPVSDPVPPQASAVLAEYHACRAGRLGVAALDPELPLLATISNRDAGIEGALDGGGATKSLRALARRAGIENADADALTLHSMRHTAASGAVNELGISIDLVRRLLRHKSVVTTQRYVHTWLQPGNSVAARLATTYSAEIVAPGSGTLARHDRPVDGVVTRAAVTAHAKVDALHRIADVGESLGPDAVAALAATMSALLERCDTADPAYGPLAEACRAVVAGGMPSIPTAATT
jgi:site-specific recombinase XerD